MLTEPPVEEPLATWESEGGSIPASDCFDRPPLRTTTEPSSSRLLTEHPDVRPHGAARRRDQNHAPASPHDPAIEIQNKTLAMVVATGDSSGRM